MRTNNFLTIGYLIIFCSTIVYLHNTLKSPSKPLSKSLSVATTPKSPTSYHSKFLKSQYGNSQDNKNLILTNQASIKNNITSLHEN